MTLVAEDGPGGSGIADTYYVLPGDAEPQHYEGSFEVPLGTVVRFSSTDKAGNVEPAQEVRVDDGPSIRETAEPTSPGDDFTRYIDSQDDEDWFTFEADGTSTYPYCSTDCQPTTTLRCTIKTGTKSLRPPNAANAPKRCARNSPPGVTT